MLRLKQYECTDKLKRNFSNAQYIQMERLHPQHIFPSLRHYQYRTFPIYLPFKVCKKTLMLHSPNKSVVTMFSEYWRTCTYVNEGPICYQSIFISLRSKVQQWARIYILRYLLCAKNVLWHSWAWLIQSLGPNVRHSKFQRRKLPNA